MQLNNRIKAAKIGYIMISILLCVLGIVLIAVPDFLGETAAMQARRRNHGSIRLGKDRRLLFQETYTGWHFNLIWPLEFCSWRLASF